MKKLKKVKTSLQDSIEAYEGVCNCSIGCRCVICSCSGTSQEINTMHDPNYANTESTSLSIANSHWSWA